MNDHFNLGDEEQQRRKMSGVSRETHERIVNAALDKLDAVKAAMPPANGDRIMEKLKELHMSVLKTMNPILIETAKKGVVDRKADKEMLAALYLQQLDAKFDKDELTFLLTALIAEQTFDQL